MKCEDFITGRRESESEDKCDFQFPSDDSRDRLLREVVLPTAQEHNLPLTLMVGVRRRVNAALREAGDAVGRADVSAI